MLRPADALRRHPGFLMSLVGRRSAAVFADALEPLGIQPRHFGALSALDASGPITQHDLGAAIGVDPSSMVALVDELEARGLVERRRSAADRRAYALEVTADGRELARRGRRIAAETQRRVLGVLDDAERAELLRLLGKVAAALDADDARAQR